MWDYITHRPSLKEILRAVLQPKGKWMHMEIWGAWRNDEHIEKHFSNSKQTLYKIFLNVQFVEEYRLELK